MMRVLLFCFGQAVVEAIRAGRCGRVEGCSEWRDAMAVLWVARNHLYGDGKAYLR